MSGARALPLLAAAVACIAAAPAPAPGRVEVRPAAKVFPYLDFYYRLDPAKRTRFAMAYRLRTQDRAPVRAAFTGAVEGSLPLGPEGWFERLPTAAELARHPSVRIEGPAGARFELSIVPEARVAPAPEMDPGEVSAAADQLNAALNAAGPLSLVLPKFKRVVFLGAQGATLVEADGRARPLEARHGAPGATVVELAHARGLRFASPPVRVLLLPG